MKKSLVALAALAATSAFAQNSVTLYGRLDLGLASVKTTTTVANVGTSTKFFDLAGAQGRKTGGRLGVTGTEDLGGGLKAGFVIETRVNPDKSAVTADGISQGTFGATRQANLNLSGGFGTVVLGTYYNAFDDLRYAHSPSIGGVPGGDTFALGTASAGVARISDRSENALGYSTPSFGGFKIRASLLNRKNADGTVPVGKKATGFGLAAGYDNGPLSVLGAFGSVKQGADPIVGATLVKVTDYGFNVKYDLGVAVPYFIYENVKNVSSLGAVVGKNKGFEIGAKFPLGAFTPYVTFNSMKNSFNAPGTTDKTRAFQVGTNYDVSKRTSLYAALGSDKVRNSTALTGSKRTGFALGLVHKF